MSKPYTDEQAEIVNRFAWEIRDGIGLGYAGHTSLAGARRLLDAVAPAIAAQTLREAAEAYGPGQITFMGSATGYTKAWLDERAFEIEAKA